MKSARVFIVAHKNTGKALCQTFDEVDAFDFYCLLIDDGIYTSDDICIFHIPLSYYLKHVVRDCSAKAEEMHKVAESYVKSEIAYEDFRKRIQKIFLGETSNAMAKHRAD